MRISLKAKLIAMMVALVVLANVLIGTVAIRVSTSAMDETIHQNLLTVAEKASKEIRDMNEKEFNLIRGLANLPFIREGSMELSEICAQLNKVVNADKNRYENIGYYNAEGFSYSAAGVYHSSKDKEYFQAAIAGKEFICDPFFSTVGNKVLQIYSVPVYGYDNHINGVITAILYGDRITDLIKQMDIGGGFHPAVIDRRNGTTIANANEGTDVEGNNVTDLDPTSELAVTLGRVVSGETGAVNFYDHNLKMKMSSSFTPVEKTEWSVFCVAPYNYFYGKLDILRMFILISLGVTVAIALIIGLILISIFIKPLRTLKTAILDIASGNADLTKRLPKASKDEIGDVVNGFNQFVGKLQEIMQGIKLSNGTLESSGVDLNASTEDTSASISEIISNIETIHTQISDQNDSVSETAGAVNEIASNIESLDRMIDSQSRGVSQASTAVEEMIGNINSVTNSMDKMADSFEKLSVSAQTGASLQSNASERIERIKSQSETLLEANRAIAAIAEQTNLLAMNAAIEAAHAGEAGKGFSVVADEIRKLSETSGEQSRTIGEQLTSIESLIDEMVTASQKSSEAFLDVTSRISDTDELVHQIKAAMEEQTIGSQQITDALHSMNDSTIEVKNASKEMSEGNKAILESVRSLQDSSTQMKSSMEIMSASAKKIDETGNALTGIAEKMKESITEIGSEINQFKI